MIDKRAIALKFLSLTEGFSSTVRTSACYDMIVKRMAITEIPIEACDDLIYSCIQEYLRYEAPDLPLVPYTVSIESDNQWGIRPIVSKKMFRLRPLQAKKDEKPKRNGKKNHRFPMKWLSPNPPNYVWSDDEWYNEKDGCTYQCNVEERIWWQTGKESIPFPPKTKVLGIKRALGKS